MEKAKILKRVATNNSIYINYENKKNFYRNDFARHLSFCF